ncbi:MAG: HAD hydrolase-like protein [Dysosmobacter welbionis]
MPSAQAWRGDLPHCSPGTGVDLADCVSVADNIKRDIPGAKAAGIGCNIIFRSPEKKHPVEFTEETRPDAVIDTFPELLELLPPLK